MEARRMSRQAEPATPIRIGLLVLLIAAATTRSFSADGYSAPSDSELETRKQAATLLLKSSCARQAASLVENWRTTKEWSRRPTDLDGGQTFVSPTEKVGVWVRLQFFPDSSVDALRVSPETTVHVTWKKGSCEPQEKTQSLTRENHVGAKYLRDADLQKIVDQRESAFIYAWSPHMPLSVKGFTAAKATARKFGLKFVPVLDPEADASTAKAAVKQNALPSDALDRGSSVELFSRQMYIHFPSVVVVSKGRFGKLYPGFWVSNEALENYVKESIQ